MNEIIHKLFTCKDCGVNTHEIHEYYMVKHDIWRNLDLQDYRVMLCIGCLEERVGRRLNNDDFLNVPLNSKNDKFPKSLRLMSRLGYLEGA